MDNSTTIFKKINRFFNEERNKIEVKVLLAILFLYLFVADIKNVGENKDFYLYVSVLVYFSAVVNYKLKSTKAIFISLASLVVFCFYVFQNNDAVVGRVLLWVYIFIVVGAIQKFFELRRK